MTQASTNVSITASVADLYRQARQWEQAGRSNDAQECYRRIVGLRPDQHSAWHQLALLAHGQNQSKLAIQYLEAAVAIACDRGEYHRNLCEIYRRAGEVSKAIVAGKRACKLMPNDVHAHYNLAVACFDARDYSVAAKHYEKALSLDPQHVESWNNLGSTREKLGDDERAAEAYRQALRIDERHSAARCNLSRLTGCDVDDQKVYSQRSADDLHLEGIALYRQGRLDEALVCYDRALALRSDFPAALNSRGFLLQDLNRLDEARACFERAVTLDPGFSMARLNLGMLQLKIGEWEAGWENYEARWTGSAEATLGTFKRIECPLPHWDGQGDTRTLRLLIVPEQGFGDCFQFVRYLPLALQRFSQVGLLCSAPMQRLIEWTWGESVTTLAHVPADFSQWDVQCLLMSLPRAFGTRPDSIPATVPYLRVTPTALAYWRERLEAVAPGRLRVGLAWTGRSVHQANARRSVPLEQLRPLFNDSRVSWFSLQKWSPEDMPPQPPVGTHWVDWTSELDFADTAALISNLDLVISIDSVMVHLAGALNQPVWMLNRFDGEWRWFHRRTDSPWYPSLQIFNQPQRGDWTSVIRVVQQELACLQPRSTPPAARASRTQVPTETLTTTAALEHVLQSEPDNAEVLHQLGIVHWNSGARREAMHFLEQAVAIADTQALFHCNLGEMKRQSGDIDAAIRHGSRAVELKPSHAIAHGNLGIAYFDARNYDAAERCQQQALQLDPTLLMALNNLGSIARERKDLAQAQSWYRKALDVQPDFIESMSNLAAVLLEQDDIEEAEQLSLRALSINPQCAGALCNLGLARLKQQRIDEAQQLIERSLKLRPGYPEALLGLAIARRDAHRIDEAVELLEQCLQGDPDNAAHWCVLASVYTENSQTEQAAQCFHKALALEPDSTEALNGLGHLRMEEGQLEDAQQLFQRALEIDPKNLPARFQMTQARKATVDDPNVAALEALLDHASELKTEQLISLHYALGKSHDDLKNWDCAFPHYLEGARLKRAKLSYDVEQDAALTQRIIALTSQERLASLSGAGVPSTLPVFVLGMPRSGTTLTEQIIASHPDVYGAGELRDLMQALNGATAATNAHFPETIAQLDASKLHAWGAHYLERLHARAPNAERITDKMPANFQILGLIPLALPGARIVHVKRNPVDTCVSCFTRLFNRHQDATYDLYELGRHYANYARLMLHWRSVMPAHSFLDVQYEDIVGDIEGQARRLIHWIGLPWHDACLDFHKTQRQVRTASIAQVRQPIYTHSVERWRHYGKYLGPLFEGLGEFAPQR